MSLNYKEIYNFETYCTKFRFTTYHEQIKLCLGCKPKSILVIGPGDHIVPIILRHLLSNTIVDTFDIREGSTYKGDLREISNIVTQKYDCILCCEVLEHIEFEYFDSIIKQLKQITNKSLIISVPKFNGKLCKYHKWEIDYNVTKNDILQIIGNSNVSMLNNKIMFIVYEQ
jgi:hypothetical protein